MTETSDEEVTPRRRVRTTHEPRVDRTLLAALAAAVLYHGGLLLAGTYARTYDALIHIFFADHYRRWWFDHWDPRWYTGFPITSYPPGSHQLVALLSHGIGLRPAFIVVQLAAILLVVTGVYRFSRVWVSRRAAGYAAVLAVLSTSIAETVHVFGQLPTMLSLGFLLNATPWIHRWVRDGDRRDLWAATAVTAATTAAHHVTTLFGAVFILGPVIVAAVLHHIALPLADETDAHPTAITPRNLLPLAARRLRRGLRPTMRAAQYATALVTVLVIVVLPYWLWSATDPITQLPIPHASRSDFLEDLNAGLVFWLVPWGLLALLLVPALVRGFRSRVWPLAASVGLLALLGTGGTTPLPRLLLRGAFDILTLDRFTFWATILILPLAGALLVDHRSTRLSAWLRERHDALPTAVAMAAVVGALLASILTANLTQFRPFQPDPIDVDPIVAFIDKDDHWRWRYLTLGFGDQVAWLGANTEAQTVDGNYHSARRLPELVTTPVERLEGAKFRGIAGIGSLQQFLTVPEKYHLKYVFSNDQFYDPLLHYSGWHRLGRLDNGIVVWERADVSPLPELLPRREIPMYQRIMWGTLPMTAITVAAIVMSVAALRVIRDRRRPAPAPRRARRARGLIAWADRRLAGLADVPPESIPAGPTVADVRRGVEARARAVRSLVPARLVRLGVGALVVAVLASVLVGLRPRPLGPVETVEAYHLALDVRDHRTAYALLDPDVRPSYEQFLLERSVEDGLVASYSMLDTVSAAVTAEDGSFTEVAATLSYVTSLERYDLPATHTLRRTPAGWRIQPDQLDLALPEERFFTRPDVDFGQQGRRRVTTGRTAYDDVLDRPEIDVISARLVRRDGRYSVVGEVVNTDVHPADLTVTVQLLDPVGEVLTQYDAGQVIVHKLLPKASTGFRIDLEGVAGALDPRDPAAGTFSPDASSPYQLPPDVEIAGIDVYAKAVVTGQDLERDLTAQRLVVADGVLEAELFNAGTNDATVPRVLVTLYDDAGVAWVDHHYVPRNVRPGRSLPVRIPLTPVDGLEVLDVDVRLFGNGLLDRAWSAPDPVPHLTGDGLAGFTGLRVEVTSFLRAAD